MWEIGVIRIFFFFKRVCLVFWFFFAAPAAMQRPLLLLLSCLLCLSVSATSEAAPTASLSEDQQRALASQLREWLEDEAARSGSQELPRTLCVCVCVCPTNIASMN